MLRASSGHGCIPPLLEIARTRRGDFEFASWQVKSKKDLPLIPGTPTSRSTLKGRSGTQNPKHLYRHPEIRIRELRWSRRGHCEKDNRNFRNRAAFAREQIGIGIEGRSAKDGRTGVGKSGLLPLARQGR